MTFKGFRTILVNGFIAVAGAALIVAEQFTGFNWSVFVDPKWVAVAVIAMNCVNIFLRSITTTPLGQKE